LNPAKVLSMKNTSPRRRSRITFRPRLECLETRLTPTTYTVSSLADSGAGSLRAAITSVNGDTTADVIDFSVAGVIQLTSGALPAITNTVNIEGTTAIRGSMATGFVNAPLVEIDNNGFDGLIINASNSTLSSLSIVNSGGIGVTLEGEDNITVVGNWIGFAIDDSVAPNSGGGVTVENSTGDIIGGTTVADRNVISGNGGDGIDLGMNGVLGGQLATVEGNFIGTDPTGQAAAANQGNGITVFNSDNTIGGTPSGAGNIIAFNAQSGVQVNVAPGNQILANSIFNNGAKGIDLQDGGNNNMLAPQLSYAVESPGSISGSFQVQVGGVLNIPPGGTIDGNNIRIQVFATLNGVPAGQGQLFLGSVSVTPNSQGFAAFTLRNASVLAGGSTTFTATATSAVALFSDSGNTSVFSNSIGLSTANQAYVANVYQLLLSRVPDPSSSVWSNMLDNGASPQKVVLGVEGSTEYLNDQVTALYSLYLQRKPDTGGAQFWVSFLQGGGTFEQVATELTASSEYSVLSGGTNPDFIRFLYSEVLARQGSNAEIAGWETLLDNGASRLLVSASFLVSQEYRTNLVQSDYLTFLLRPTDPSGLTTWVDALNAGFTDQEVLASIFGSLEGYQLWS
jgi:hypothetical protein